MSSETSKLILKASLPRTGDLSFVGRFHHNFGFEAGLFEYLLDQKDMWGEKLFYVNEGQFSKWVEQGKHKIREIPVVAGSSGFPAAELEPVSKSDFDACFGHSDPIDLNITKGGNVAHHILKAGDSVSLKDAIDRNGLAVHVGGYVTAMKWLHYSTTSFLAVFVINSKDGLSGVINDPSLSVFQQPASVPRNVKSALQIWEYTVESSSLTLSQVFDTSTYGVTSRLVWVPAKYTGGEHGSDSGSESGVLSGIFTDGSLHFFGIHAQSAASAESAPSTTYHKVTKPSWSISLSAERKNHTSPIPLTAFDFLDHERVVVGTLDGAIAEFSLPSSNSPHNDDIHIPSFVTYITDSMITSVCVSDVNASKVMLVNTATAQSFAIQYDQIRQGRVELGYTISTLQPLYHRTYRIFVYPDSAESIGYTFARYPHQKHSLLLKTELISTFHVSEYLNHPFAVVGNTCGDVYVMNIGRKIFGMPKAHNKLVVPLKIWTLYKAPGESGLTLSGDYIPVTPDRNEVMSTFTPPEVVISAAAWNENFQGSSTYAFGTYTGLLVLERLDPVLI
ncbi:hypothetical protein JCM33374_g1412 [Metschnikowia sp. JCM 33374]|nr:hypothetical protein JCM33374_g1412 [Metschnikowia sp. JCM 33374]